MRRLILLLGVLFCSAAYAATETINWFVDGGVYATTTCESGGDITLPPTPTKYGYTFQGWSNYKRLEYIESTGTQYINTGIAPNSNQVIDVSGIYTANAFVFGSRYGPQNEESAMVFDQAVPPKFRILFGGATISNTVNVLVAGSPYSAHIENGDSFITQDGNITKFSANFGTSFVKYPMYLFLVNQIGQPYNLDGFATKISSFSIKEGDKTIIDLIPVLDPDGTACMYDLVEQKYYYNAGTGDFIAGPVVGE